MMKQYVSFFLIITMLTWLFIGCVDKKTVDVNGDVTPSATASENEISSKKDLEDEKSGQTLAPTGEQTGTEMPDVTEKPEPTESETPINQNKIEDYEVGKDDISSAMNFAVQFLKQSVNPTKSNENTLISPFSVMTALSMIANGAEGETLEQIEQTLGMSIEELNRFVYAYTNSLPKDEKYKLNVANSIWINGHKNFKINDDFKKANEEYYGAEIFTESFTDDTVKKINDWVNKNTDGMIPKIMEELRDTDVLYLLNALAFDAEWQDCYASTAVKNGLFTCENGVEVGVDFMYGNEGIYIEDSTATGFVKYYKDNSYAFVALLPNEGISVSQYIQSLNGKHLQDIISSASYRSVDTVMPKFTIDYSDNISSVLQNMGIKTAFDSAKADFSGAGKSSTGNLCINQVIHHTHIEVNEGGTRAGAVTEIVLPDGCAPEYIKEVRLNRPFVYMIIDCENNLPIFMGTMINME